MATLKCPSCQESFMHAEVSTGDKVRCPRCRREFAYTGDFKRKLILAVSLSAVAIALIIAVIIWGARDPQDEGGRNKTQQLINDKAKMAVQPAEKPR